MKKRKTIKYPYVYKLDMEVTMVVRSPTDIKQVKQLVINF